MKRFFFPIVFLIFPLLFFESWLWAQDAQISIKVIYAQKSKDFVAPELQDFKELLNKNFASIYNHFEFLVQHNIRLKIGGKTTLKLPDKDQTELTLEHGGWTQYKGQLKLNLDFKDKIKTATVQLTPGAIFFQAGLPYKDGILILAIRGDRAKPPSP